MRYLLLALLLLLVGCRTTPEPPLGTAIVHPVDGAIMVYVPVGFFPMGLTESEANEIARELGYEDYRQPWMWEAFPKRQVYLGGFFIDQYEVTVGRWRRFLAANPDFTIRRDEMSSRFDRPESAVLPVATVHWDEAQQYANWAGKLLPTNAQWEKAARGTDGRYFPWGNTFSWDKGHFRREGQRGWDGEDIYTRVGRYPAGASPCGAMDLVGNQYEFTAEWMEPYPNNPEAAKMLPFAGHRNVCLRGGSWYHGRASLYAAKRFGLPPDETHYHIAFRTVWEPPPGYFASEEFARAKAAVPARRAELAAQFAAFDQAEAASREAK